MNVKQLYLSLISISLIVNPGLIGTAATKPECSNLSQGSCGGNTNKPPEENGGSKTNSSQTSTQKPGTKPHSPKQPEHHTQPHTP